MHSKIFHINRIGWKVDISDVSKFYSPKIKILVKLDIPETGLKGSRAIIRDKNEKQRSLNRKHHDVRGCNGTRQGKKINTIWFLRSPWHLAAEKRAQAAFPVVRIDRTRFRLCTILLSTTFPRLDWSCILAWYFGHELHAAVPPTPASSTQPYLKSNRKLTGK